MTTTPMAERAWAAGFWDGEGSTVPHGRARRDGRKPGIKMYVSQKHTGPELLLRFQAAIGGYGKVHERTDRPGVWVWVCTTRRGCQAAIDAMWPHLSTPKRLQIERVNNVSA